MDNILKGFVIVWNEGSLVSITAMAGIVNYACAPLSVCMCAIYPLACWCVFVVFICQFCVLVAWRLMKTCRLVIVQTERHQGKDPRAKQPRNALGSAVNTWPHYCPYQAHVFHLTAPPRSQTPVRGITGKEEADDNLRIHNWRKPTKWFHLPKYSIVTVNSYQMDEWEESTVKSSKLSKDLS